MIICLQDCPSQPWKNGLGRTRELAVYPPEVGSGEFLWRVSIAEVDSAAPFSRFPGIDRQIVLLDGKGFTMALDDGRVHALNTRLQPFAFPGEAAIEVTLVDGTTLDFNLMLRRGRLRGEVLPWRYGTRVVDATTVLVYCTDGMIDTAEGPLHPGDAWLPSAHPAGSVTLHDGAAALAVCVEAHAA